MPSNWIEYYCQYNVGGKGHKLSPNDMNDLVSAVNARRTAAGMGSAALPSYGIGNVLRPEDLQQIRNQITWSSPTIIEMKD